jgi:hypothetical protein
VREKGVRKERGEAFLLLKMPVNAETRLTHICAIERAAHIFISSYTAVARKRHLFQQSGKQVCELYRQNTVRATLRN